MGVVARQSIKSIIIIFTGAVLGAAINFIFTIVFEKNELGLITNLTNQAVIVQSFVMMGAASVVVGYLPNYQKDEAKRSVVLTTTLLIPLFTIALFTILYAIFKNDLIGIYQPEDQPYIDKYYFWLPLIVTGLGYSSLFEYYLVSRMKAAQGSLIREVVFRSCLLLLIGLYAIDAINFSAFVLLMTASYLFQGLSAMFLAIKSGGLQLSLRFGLLNRKEYGRLFHFSWYHLLEGVALNLLGYIDSLMLAPLATDGMSTLSVYRNAIFIATVMVMPFRALSASSYPVLNQAYIDEAWTKLKNLYQRANNNTFIIGMALCVLIFCNLDNVVRIFPEGYEFIKPVTAVLLIGKLVQMFAGVSSEVLSFSKYYKFNFRISALLILLIVILNRYLIPDYGIMGAALSATVSLTIFSISKMIYLRVKLNLPVANKHMLQVLIAGIIALVAGTLLPFVHHAITDAIIRSMIIAFVYAATLFYLAPNSDFGEYLKNVIKNRKIF